MTSSIFVDGICEITDEALRSYFQKFGSKISALRSSRHQSTHSCCFAFITFTSVHTGNAIMKHRPHQIGTNPIFVKRLNPKTGIHSFPEQLIPITRLVFMKTDKQQANEDIIRSIFKPFGTLTKCEFRRDTREFIVEFDDYDSADRSLIEQDYGFYGIELNRECLTDALKTSQYFGICRRKAEIKLVEETSAKPKLNLLQHYEATFRKKNEELAQCRALLKKKDEDFVSLQQHNEGLQRKLAEWKQKQISSCQSCEQHQATIARLKQGIIQLNDSYEQIQSRYQQLLTSRSEDLPAQTRKLCLSTRLNIDESKVDSAVARFPSRRNFSDQVVTSNTSETARQRPLTPQSRIKYQYESVTNNNK